MKGATTRLGVVMVDYVTGPPTGSVDYPVVLTNNRFEDMSTVTVNKAGARIIGNTVAGAGLTYSIFLGSDGMITTTGAPQDIENNTLDSLTRSGIWAGGMGFPIWVRGNTLTSDPANTQGTGIVIDGSDQLVMQNNQVGGSNHGFPGAAIDARFRGDLTTAVSGNTGAGNGMDAIQLSQSAATADFTWITPTNAPGLHPLGYVLSNTFTVTSGVTMTVPAGAVVPSIYGSLELLGGRFNAAAGGAIFTSLQDGSTGNGLCPTCAPPAAGDWKGLLLSVDPYSLQRGERRAHQREDPVRHPGHRGEKRRDVDAGLDHVGPDLLRRHRQQQRRAYGHLRDGGVVDQHPDLRRPGLRSLGGQQR